jgi:hypothetical protein
MKSLHFMLAVGAAVAALPITAAAQKGGVPAGASAPQPALVSAQSNCTAKSRAFVTNDFQADSTTSSSFVLVPGATVPFTIGGTSAKNCVAVTFSAMTFAANSPSVNQLMMVQAYLDGVPMQPGEVQFSGDDDQDADGAWARSQSYTWVASAVPAGGHTVEIGYRSFFGGSVFIHRRTTVVQFK